MNNDFGFIIATCLRTNEHVNSLHECISSIQNFHPTNIIVVVVDFTSNEEYVSDSILKFPSVIFEVNTPSVPADMLMLKYFKDKHYFSKAITLQDSMKLTSKVDISKSSGLDYLWHFTNHRVHWHIIEEPQTEFNVQQNIRTHDDLVEFCVRTMINKKDFQEYCNTIYRKKELWSGCFGCLCVIDYNTLCELDEKTGIINLMMQMKDNRLRRAIESLFSLACQYTLQKEIHTSFDGLYYDGKNYHNNFQGICVSKKSFNRQ
jgi:hypothetical protein